jgi:hypothetical protein
MFFSYLDALCMSSRTLWFMVVTLVNLLLFAAMEWALWSGFNNPSHAIERRHLISPKIEVSRSLFGEYRGSADIPVNFGADPQKIEYFQGVRIRTGAYGDKVTASSLRILDAQKKPLCGTSAPFAIAENNWTAPPIRCHLDSDQKFDPRFLSIEVTGESPWAVFSGGSGMPAAQIWFNEPSFNSSFAAARNYGGLWEANALFSLRLAARVLIAIAAAWLIVFWRQSYKKNLVAGFLVWVGLMFGQLAETVSYQNPDETQHSVGAFRSITPQDGWQSLYKNMKDLGSKVQFKETFTKVGQPIVPGQDGEPWVSDDHFFVDPSVRSGIYAWIMSRINHVPDVASNLELVDYLLENFPCVVFR